ncbi:MULTISPECIES: carotenoid oxygenase family protein [unclassified Okeania]|uniref:carotenoid oxygenase family protein n=1 Tax=unclassified Okeania TaxID=2634635 RepID=UPI0013B65148|nr:MULTISPECIES: carotenoid oxygenase family protein [unclassified Okeania]NES78386.1 Apocarotenoid-15,15'-oxygenase [Okeania sp. SIO1H4]NET21042.1 Apocarotenoid-15,15'-oxygenase [Okeania sp. SIO1H5]NET95073.1 Apocarotenoid-15,15'-oxygenase [Okeania sp. SIO1H2]
MTNLQIEKSTSYTREDWQKGYESQPNEYDYWIDDIEGEIPADLNGTFFRNGPGLLDINGQAIAHPFDGDGMVCAIGFKNGRAHFRNSFVKTEGYVAEKAAGKILYRGVFGTQKPGGWLANIFDLKNKNIANTGILYWGNKLLALWEGAEPHQLNPKTLETIKLDDLDGILQPGQAFSAHPRIEKGKDGKGDVLVNFSVKPGLSSTITIFEFNSQGKLFKRYSNSIPGFAFLHDMAITPNYCIFFQNPVTLNPIPFFLGLRGAGQCLKFSPNKSTQVILIPRDGSKAMKILETKPCFIFHHANAWEKNGEIYVDSICYESFPQVDMGDDFRELDFDSIPASQLWRFKINLSENNVEHKLLESRCCDFPNLNPNNVGEAYRYLFIGVAEQPSGNAPLQAILKIDWQTGERQIFSVAPRGFAGEPLFVPFPNGVNEDDGWLLMLMYDAAEHRSDVVILDARDLNKKPVAILHLKHHIPYGLHGSFTPHYFGE